VPEKHYISAEQLLKDSFELATTILESGFKPTFIAGIWRGGTPVGIAIQELLRYKGIESDHTAIKTSLYTGIDQTSRHVSVYGLSYLVDNLNSKDRLLIVDDVFDSGRTVDQIIKDLKSECKKNTPEIRVATPYFKPTKNQTNRTPDYYIHETENWLIFPHELVGLSKEEILLKPGIECIQSIL